MLRGLGVRGVLARRTTTTTRRWCGIVAAFDFKDANPSHRATAAVISEACDRIRHRGPDGRGFAAGGAPSHRWALGHTRLAIVAPHETAAAQPFELRASSATGAIDGAWPSSQTSTDPHAFVDRVEDHHHAGGSHHHVPRVALAANGEIYTHKELYRSVQSSPTSHSDCEVIAHLYAELGPRETLTRLTDAGMFSFVLIDDREPHATPRVFAARDPTGIKPLYYGLDSFNRVAAFASELKALTAIPGLASLHEVPAGHCFVDGEFFKYYDPEWRRRSRDETHVELEEEDDAVDKQRVRAALDRAVGKRMMTDVPFGLFLSGGVDSCIVAQLMVKRCRDIYGPNFKPPSYTVGMENSPDLTAAREMAKILGTDHHERIFEADEAISIVDDVVYHMETYNAELIRSAIPNWFLAERASQDVKMVLTGEGADELWAGYAYFKDAPSPKAVQKELSRIYDHLGVANLLRTDRMTMAHSLEARVPFLDIGNTTVAMNVHPRKKLTAGRTGPNGEPGEKAFLRSCFEESHGGITIPKTLLYRAKAMQAEGVGKTWVSILQKALEMRVSDAEFNEAARRFPHETPQSKEEYYYRMVFDRHYPNADQVPTLWTGGCRAAGADWHSDTYTRFGLVDTDRLSHAFEQQQREDPPSQAMIPTLAKVTARVDTTTSSSSRAAANQQLVASA